MRVELKYVLEEVIIILLNAERGGIVKAKELECTLALIAKKVSSKNVNSACWMIMYQPPISKLMQKKLKKHL